MMIVRLPRFFSPSSTTPSISDITAGSFGRRASKSSGDARQTAGDVLRAGRFASGLGEQVSRFDLLAVFDLDVGAFGDWIEGQRLSVLVLEHELRVEVTLVLDDLLAHRSTACVALDLHGLAVDQVLVLDRALELRKDRARCAGPSGTGFRPASPSARP
jgi:hypothetical protein